ncbi:ubiquitin carboxyl-terminal hydrolase 16-like, partial [Trifolium medium]|nr:ubiquitin carboxyl-terminal hydrolase 16-like [Trifolium medium]
MDSDETNTSFPLESKNPVNIEDKNCSSSKRSKKKSSNTSDESGFKSKVPKVKFDTSHDVASNLGGHEHRRKVSSVEKSVADTSKGRAVPSSSSSNIDVAADYVEESHLSRYKEARRSSSSSRDRLLATAKGDLISHSMSTKTENYHALPSKVSIAPNPPQNVRSGLKTSMQKVVQQFRSSKESRSNQMSVENELGFPYELFVELYCYDKVKLFPFGLTNCGN